MSTDLERGDLERRLRDALHHDAERARLVNPDQPANAGTPLPLAVHRRRTLRKLVAVAAAVTLIAAAGIAVIQDRDQAHVNTTDPADSPTSSTTTTVEPPVVTVEDPPTPEPGEQPAGRAAAEEQVRTAFTTIFDSHRPREERAEFSERPAVWTAATQELVEGQYADAVRDIQAVVEEVVFTSPTHAAVRFRFNASDERVPLGPYIGDAVLVEGRWLVTIATTCERVAIAGVECDLTR